MKRRIMILGQMSRQVTPTTMVHAHLLISPVSNPFGTTLLMKARMSFLKTRWICQMMKALSSATKASFEVPMAYSLRFMALVTSILGRPQMV
jgi:hypothetical protein